MPGSARQDTRSIAPAKATFMVLMLRQLNFSATRVTNSTICRDTRVVSIQHSCAHCRRSVIRNKLCEEKTAHTNTTVTIVVVKHCWYL